MSDILVTKANNMRRIRCWGRYGTCGVFKSQRQSRWEVWSDQVRRLWSCGHGGVISEGLQEELRPRVEPQGALALGEGRGPVEERE